MELTTPKLYSLSYKETKTYVVAIAFIIGNILFPQLCHLVQQGGFIWLPIYFFTLIGAYKYGWRVGLLTAIFSPVVNHLLFGMPPSAVLPSILVKSILLALSAGLFSAYFKRINLAILTLVVCSYQGVGTLVEWGLIGDLRVALQDFRLGIPGMMFQLFGGYLTLKYLIRD